MGGQKATVRRKFIQQITALCTAAIVAPKLLVAAPDENNVHSKGYTFLFQGDSITDGNRTRDNDWNHVMGHGYAYLIASRLWYDFPKSRFHFYNRGISGNKLTDLQDRWQQDTLEIKPNLLSILIGINDVDALLKGNAQFSAAQYEQDYRQLLQQTKQQLPAVQLVLCEPFILAVGRIKDRWQEYAAEIDKRREIVARLGNEFDAVVVKFQDAFDKALSKAPADYWVWDGIHPMPAGHELMAREWIMQVGKKLPFVK